MVLEKLETIVKKTHEFINSDKGFIVTSGLIVLGTIGDILTTSYDLARGAEEINFVARSIIDNYGMLVYNSIKAFVPIASISIATRVNPIRYFNLVYGAFLSGWAVNNVYIATQF